MKIGPSYCHDLDAHVMKRALADARPERLALALFHQTGPKQNLVRVRF